jgi:diaminohydroxyphosphoribosylaminopyrimidine deaminase / 5-amino-6-(5-phosphoribosylamino)uracil reductase
VVQLPFDRDWPQKVCDHLHTLQVLSVLVEGGAKTLQAFLDHGLWDEARVFKATHSFGAGLKAPVLRSRTKTEKKLDADTLTIYTHD